MHRKIFTCKTEEKREQSGRSVGSMYPISGYFSTVALREIKYLNSEEIQDSNSEI